jgi:hypothetical protein
MPARKPPPPDARPQIEDFIETARKLGADESREAFERAFEKVAKAPVTPVTLPPRQPAKRRRAPGG